MKQLDYPQSKDSATNLLAGIDTATNRLLAPTVTAETFDAVAQLLRAGGIRQSYGEATSPQEVKVAPAPVPSDWLQPKIFKSSDASKV
jgi:hypothetical protein